MTTRSAVEHLADLAQPRAYWIELLMRAGARGLELQRTSDDPGDLKSARQRCRYMMEGALHGRHPRGLTTKKTIDKLVSKLMVEYQREVHALVVKRTEWPCQRSVCSMCRPYQRRNYFDWRAERNARRAEIRKERRQRRKQKKQRARPKKERRKKR